MGKRHWQVHNYTMSSSPSAYSSPLLDIGHPIALHLTRSSATLFHLLPATLRSSSFHLAWGRLSLRLPIRGLHLRTRLPQRSLVLWLIWPAHCHFSLLILWAMSTTFVLCRITSLRIRSRRKTSNILCTIRYKYFYFEPADPTDVVLSNAELSNPWSYHNHYIFWNFPRIILIFFFHMNLLLPITNTIKKELAKSVQLLLRLALSNTFSKSFLCYRFSCFQVCWKPTPA